MNNLLFNQHQGPKSYKMQKAMRLSAMMKALMAVFALLFIPQGIWADDYPIIIGDTQVTSNNASNVLGDGKISFTFNTTDASGILTLNNATIEGGIVWTGSNLTIKLIGENDITNTAGDAITGNIVSFTPNISITKAEGADNVKLTLTSSAKISDASNQLIYQPINGFNINTNLFDLWNANNTGTRIFTSKMFSGGSGTDASPYLISTPDDLTDLATYVNRGVLDTNDKYFKLENDIDCSGLEAFEPIGYRNYSFYLPEVCSFSFEGTLDGDNHTISGIRYNDTIINPDHSDGIGLFCYLYGTVKNLTLSNCTFGGGYCNGAIAEFLSCNEKKSAIENCTINSCTIESNGGMVGGIAGYVQSGSTIKNCSVINSTIQNGNSMGGIASFTESGTFIQNCTIDGGIITINEDNTRIGGIVPENAGTISNCVVKGTTIECNAESTAGAIASFSEDGTLDNNYYYGDVTIKIGNTTMSGHTERGVGYYDNSQNYLLHDIDGAMLYTKKLSLPFYTHCTLSGVADEYYKSDAENIYVAPGLTTKVVVTPIGSFVPTAVSVTYTPTGGAQQTITPTKAADSYTYSFEMPDADATFKVTSAINMGSNFLSYQIASPTYTALSVVLPSTITMTEESGVEALVKTLEKGTDYTIEGYKNGQKQAMNSAPVDAGSYFVTIKGKDGYTGTKDIQFTINKADLNDVTIATIDEQTYTGSAIQPKVTVTYNGVNVNDNEYSVQYDNNMNISTDNSLAKVTLTSNGLNFMPNSTKTTSFRIVPVKYDLWIDDIQVTERNCTDILGDGSADQGKAASFQYVPSLNKLFITNNTDNRTIRTANDEGLTIYLAPNSTNAVGNIVYNGNSNATLTITTDGNYPGTVSLSANANVISGFSSLTLEQSLVIMSPEDIVYDGSNRRLATTAATIGAPLTPITKDRTITPDGNELKPESGSEDINKVVDDILYTLGNVNNSNGDGYDDGGFIVINTVTTDQQAVRVTQEFTPGTNEYLEGFKGLTFMVPAGNGKIFFDMQTLDGYAMKVMVGDAAPVTVKKAEKGIVEIPYNVAEPTYVYAYNAGKVGNTSSARGIQKGKMTTVHIKVYGTSVKTNKVKQSNSAAQASGGEYRGDTSALEGQKMETDEEIEAGKGDINGDEAVNVADIVGLANAIMGRHSATFDKRAADANGDGRVNAEDIVIIMNKMIK